ncbi:MAG: hypothetical protein HQK76_12515 [Desulfobacterales bacterium]|nr:hypothetical protein [Desulfobacterales bacterium]
MFFYLENKIPMSAVELWQTMHTPIFDAFVAKEYNLLAYIELEKQISNDIMQRRVRIISKIDGNYLTRSIAKKILGSDILVYEEIQKKYLNSFELHWRIIPPVFEDKFEASGILRLKPINENQCIRIREGTINIALFGADRLMKIIAAAQSKKNEDRFSQIVKKWKTESQIV